MMLDKLAQLFGRPAARAPDPLRRPLAIAVLLAETARADFNADEVERSTIQDLLQRHCGVDESEAARLLDQALASSRDAVSLHGYLRTLNDELDAPARSELMLWLWRVAYADGRVDPLEESRVRKIADLLYVPHSEFVRRRLQAEQEAGVSGDGAGAVS